MGLVFLYYKYLIKRITPTFEGEGCSEIVSFIGVSLKGCP